MARTRTTWNQKLEDKGLPKMEPMPEKMARAMGRRSDDHSGSPEVNASMHTVPKGKLTTIEQIR